MPTLLIPRILLPGIGRLTRKALSICLMQQRQSESSASFFSAVSRQRLIQVRTVLMNNGMCFPGVLTGKPNALPKNGF